MWHRYLYWLRKQSLSRRPAAYLLFAQLLSMVLYAAFDGAPGGRALLSVFGVLVLALAVWVVSHSTALTWIAWLLAIPAAILSLASLFTTNANLAAWAALFEAGLYFYTAGSLIVYMMADSRVTTDEMFAAGATFTLIAWGFANLYLVCQAWLPGSFEVTSSAEMPLNFIEMLSLSFTNLSATGLGDILPISPAARVLVMLEQGAGVGYIAMVVSRLVGMTLTRRNHK